MLDASLPDRVQRKSACTDSLQSDWLNSDLIVITKSVLLAERFIFFFVQTTHWIQLLYKHDTSKVIKV